MDATSDRLIGKLRQLAPAKVRVVNASDEAYDVAVPNRRKRWSQVTETIESRPWVRAELMDKYGAVLGFVENDGAAGEIEELGATAAGGKMGDMRIGLELMLRSQHTALSFRDKEHTALLGAMRDMLQLNMEMLRETMVLLREQRDIAAETAAMRASAIPTKEDGIDVEEIVKLLKASPKALAEIAPMVAPLLMALRGGSGPIVARPAPSSPPSAPPPTPPPAPPPAPPPSSPRPAPRKGGGR